MISITSATDGFFIDPDTDEVLSSETTDANGQDLIGEDEFGQWWGTSRAYWKLEDSPFLVDVSGFTPDGRAFNGCFIGSDIAAIRYAERWGRVTYVDSGDRGAYTR